MVLLDNKNIPQLFKSVFTEREDVFAVRWEKKKRLLETSVTNFKFAHSFFVESKKAINHKGLVKKGFERLTSFREIIKKNRL
jgi:hypothetical protein